MATVDHQERENAKSRASLDRRHFVAGAGLAGVTLYPNRAAGTALTPARLQDGGTPGGVLRVAHFADAVGLDPHIATAMTSQHVFEQVYSTIIRFNDRLEIEPDLAESWEVSEDGTSYTFRLREGVTWHNGREFTADDVKYSIDRIVSLGGSWSARFESVSEIVVDDPRTIRFTLTEPFAPFLAILAEPKAAIVPQEVVEEHGDLQQVMVGTGPFVFEEYRSGDQVRLVKNPEYWEEGLPYVDELVIRIMPDEVTRIAAVRSAEVDLAPLTDPISLQVVTGDQNLQILDVQLLQRHVLVLQTEVPALADPRVRQALMLATDREEIVATALAGLGTVSGPFPPGLGEWSLPPEELPFYTPDLDQARALLGEAGVGDGFEVTMYASPAYSVHVPIAEILQQQWQEIGVTVNIESIEWGVLLDHWSKGTFEILSMPYAGRTDPYFYTYERYHSESPGNASQFKDAKMDELVVAGAETVDVDARMEIYNELQEYIVDQAPIIFIATGSEVFAMGTNVRGYKGMATGWRTYYRETSLE